MKTTIIIIIVACLIGLLAYKINHYSEVVRQEGNIRVQYEGVFFPNMHKGGKHVLYYGSKRVCSDIAGISPNYYLKSPDSNSILYVNEKKFEQDLVHSYEIYQIPEDRVIPFQAALHLAGLNGKVEWIDSKVILSDEHQTDTLSITEGKVVIERLRRPENVQGPSIKQ